MKKKISNNFFGSSSKIKNIIMTRRTLFGAAFVVFALALTGIFWQQTSFAQRNHLKAKKINEKQAENVWQTVEKSAVANLVEGLPDDFQTLRLDKQKLASLLAAAPHESRTPLRNSELILQFPMPDGTFSRFRVQEAPVIEESMQAKFPEIKTYRILDIDNAGTTGRISLTPLGFHATIISPDESFVILPADAGDNSLYAIYNDRSQSHVSGDAPMCLLDDKEHSDSDKTELIAPQLARGDTLKTYRMAFSTTFEYSRDLGGGTVNGTVASIVVWLNGLNSIYEREVSVRLIMVADYDAIFTNSNDPYDDRNINTDPGPNDAFHVSILHNRVRNELRDKVGESNYNIGHLLTTKTIGGVAAVSAVCDNSTQGEPEFQGQPPPTVGARKGAGHSALINPVGNLGSLSLLAHEVGHQFGGTHTQNGNGSTQGNACARSSVSAYETGSGNTIMSYNGTCGNDNITGGSDLRFHGYSYDQITDHIINGSGSTCGIATATNNNPPTVSAGADYTIPKLTPFTLTATGSDPNDPNSLTYTWEQFQGGGATYFQDGTAASYMDALTDPVTTTRPIFRAKRPTGSSSRTFPSLEYILNNANIPPDKDGNGLWTAEQLPSIERTLDFRVTSRDNVGGVNNDLMTVAVKNNAGPFTVVDPTGNWTGGTSQTVTWNVANTGAGTSVNAAKVRISLSTDGGQSFPTTLAPNTDNNGSASVTVPNYINTSTARIKVEAVGNIFFDISGTNFSITSAGSCPIVTGISPTVAAAGSQVVITGTNFTGANAVAFNDVTAPTFTVDSNTKISFTVPNGATGGAITVTKPGCAAAESGNFTVCPGTAAEISLDDGSLNFFGGAYRNISYQVNRITPTSYPATLSEVKIYHRAAAAAGQPAGSAGLPVGKAITVLSAANPSGGTNINNTTFRTRAATVSKQNAFESYSIEPITITSGDFIVGYSFVNGTDANPNPNPNETFYTSPIAIDDANLPYRSYESGNGTNFTPSNVYSATPDVFMIRAFAYSGDYCSIGKCASTISIDDGTAEATGGPGETNTHYYVNRITPTSYPATLTGVRLYTPFPAQTNIDVLSAANPTGNTNINNTSFNKNTVNTTAQNSYATYTVAPITIYSGDFIVGYSVQRQAGAPSISVDITPPLQGRSYFGTGNGATLNTDPGGVNYLIRAVLFSNSCADTCTYSLTTTAENPFSAEGGEAVVFITTQAGCVWRIGRRNEWLSVNLRSGIGNGATIINVAQNSSTVYRTGSFVVGPPNGIFFENNLSGNNLFENNPPENNLLEGEEILIEQEALAPTAASVSIGGRVLTFAGRGLGGAIVSLVDHRGQTRITRTNPFGYYRFDEIAAGDTIVLKAAAKRQTFTPQVVNANNSIANLDFISRQ